MDTNATRPPEAPTHSLDELLHEKASRLPAPARELVQRLMDQAVDGTLDLAGLFGSKAVADRTRLAGDVERFTSEFAPLAERCFRALAAVENEMIKVDSEDYEMVRSLCGVGRLHDALWILASTVDAARLERPNFEPAWWTQARAELGLNESGVDERG
jgi:hypothetical protein